MLSDIRRAAGMTQEELSEASGVPRRTIQDWERFGVSPRTASQLIAMSDALGCTVDQILRDDRKTI